MDAPSRLKCSSCGFAVFNRRYPRCGERCGALLPEGVAYSKDQVAAFRMRERPRNSNVVREQMGLIEGRDDSLTLHSLEEARPIAEVHSMVAFAAAEIDGSPQHHLPK
jgi:hypothetical protein